MMRQTRCDGVIVGRGCLGRPWLFRDLSEVFDVMFPHARRLADWFGERTAMHSFRRHASWYTKGFRISSEIRAALMRVETLVELEDLFRDVDRSQPFPPSAMR